MFPPCSPELLHELPRCFREVDAYLYGVDLFNAGYFWECHEAFESIWLLLPRGGRVSTYLQGLIQYAAFLLKSVQGVSGAQERLREAACSKLDSVYRDLEARAEPRMMGLSLGPWLVQARDFSKAIADAGGDVKNYLADSRFPFLILECV